MFKSGDPNDHKNYRPISLLPVLSKIFEKLVYTRLITFLNKHKVLHELKHGFKSKFITCTALFELTDTLTMALDNKQYALSVFIDVSKAFDSINHNILPEKLNWYGIRGVANFWFRSYLYNRFQNTQINTVSSYLKLITTGVTQGSTLGSLLYLIYVNDIFNAFSTSKCIFYADDTPIVITGISLDHLMLEAKAILTLLSQWFSNNLLAPNDKKTKYVIFHNNMWGRYFGTKFDTLLFDNHTVSRSVNICYLVVMLDQHGKPTLTACVIKLLEVLLYLRCRVSSCMPMLCLMYI